MALDRTWYDTLVDDSGDGDDGTPWSKVDVDALMDVIDNGRKWAVAYNSAAQNIPNNTETVLTFDSEDSDGWGLHSTVTNTGRMTIPVGTATGTYLVRAQVFVDNVNTTGTRQLALRKNGSKVRSDYRTTPNGGNLTQQVEAILSLAAGDYVDLTVLQSSGVAVNYGSASRDLAASLEIVQVS